MPDHDPTDADARSIALSWLEEMQDCVRNVDFSRCLAIFAPDVVGYGTKAAAAIGLRDLEQSQWRHVWGRIRNFTFSISSLSCGQLGESGIWLACPWDSETRAEDGNWRTRPGRITAVLEQRDGVWLAVHTHHSLIPESAGVIEENRD